MGELLLVAAVEPEEIVEVAHAVLFIYLDAAHVDVGKIGHHCVDKCVARLEVFLKGFPQGFIHGGLFVGEIRAFRRDDVGAEQIVVGNGRNLVGKRFLHAIAHE